MPRSSFSALSTRATMYRTTSDRRVPDAKLLAEVWVEGFEEGLVEVRDGLSLVEAVEEGVAVYAVEGRGRPVEHLDEVQGFQTPGVGELLK